MSMYLDNDPDEVEDEVPGTSNDSPEENGNNNNQNGGSKQSFGQKMVEKRKEKAKKKLEKEAVKNAKKMALKGALSHIMMYAFAIIVVLIIIIGIIMFLVTMPGMVMEKLKAIFKAVGNYVAAFFGADTTEQIDDTEIFETLDYLEQMGYDLKGEGFLSGYETLDSLETLTNELPDGSYKLDKDVGVIRNTEDDTIAQAQSDFIFTYIMSDNYVYTIKNENLVTQEPGSGFWEKVVAGVMTARYKIGNFFAGPIYEFLGVKDAVTDAWGKGMLVFYKEDGAIGDRGSIKDTGVTLWDWDWDTIKVDTESKKLSIKRKSLLNNNNAMEFSLDGWTGRYGMPLEFLLSVHKATGMPDLTVDMVNSFPTEIEIILHKTSGEAVAAYKGTKGYIEYSVLNNALTGVEGRNFFSAVLSWFDNLSQSDQEVRIATELGVDHAPDCSCVREEVEGYTVYSEDGTAKVAYKNEDGTYYINEDDGTTTSVSADDIVTNKQEQYTDICSQCKSYLSKVITHIRDNNDYNFEAYTPYISRVTNHWYRDVYFVIDNHTKSTLDKDFVQYDYDYEALMKERWTLYETYTNNPDDGYKYNPGRVGEFILFVIAEDGSFKKENGEYVLFDGEVEDARPSILYEKDGNEYKEYKGNYNNTEGKELYRKNSKYQKDPNNEDEYVKYEGTVAVAKKAVALELNQENLEDVGWLKSDGIWSAYDIEDTTSGYEPLYTEEEIAEETDETVKKIMEKCYINLNLTGNLVQVGEGLRTETNYEIKKMFLQNSYFKYDGSRDSAEIITALREKVYEERLNDSNNENNYKYGPVTDEEREMTVTIESTDSDENETSDEYAVKDYSGKVMLTQDSLNAFSMLENTHTLDADYIYRDFKELIVELGYFEKEELTDETPRLLQFPIPEIGSGGYPERVIDKRDNEFGTMIHSKYDIEANEKNTIMYMLTKYLEVEGEGDADGNTADTQNAENSMANAWQDTSKIDSLLSSVGSVSAQEAIDAGNPTKEGDYSSSTSGITAEDFLAKAREICEYMDNVGYDYCVTDGVLCDHQGYATCKQGLPITFEVSKDDRRVCCATLVSWVLRDVGVEMGECTNQNLCSVLVPYLVYQLGGEVITEYSELEPGDILCYIHEASDGEKLGHVDILGEEDGDGYVKYNGGHYVDSSNSSIGSFNKASYDSEYLCFGVRLFGNKSKGDNYVGFEGNEAVVSPVTGILLEYGTYDKETDIDSTTDEPYRVNVDLKYGTPITAEDLEKDETEQASTNNQGNDNTNGSTTEELPSESRIVSDQVGYAKILVLDKEYYEKLEKYTDTKWKNSNATQGLLTDAGIYTDEIMDEEDLEEIMNGSNPELTESIYGYKEYAERYEMGGIAGYVLYIDGFKTELPDEEFSTEEESEEDASANTSKEKPQGKALTIDSFKVNPSKIAEENENIISLYEEPDPYKLASEKATKKLEVEEKIKTETAPAITINDSKDGDIIFIKEGTVIGRTYTNQEIVEDLRNEKMEDYVVDEVVPQTTPNTDTDSEEENKNKLIGNYLRIQMFTNIETDEIIEDVENYMKLDEMESTEECAFEHLAYFLGCLEEGFYPSMDLGDSYGVEVLEDGAGNTTAFGLTKAVAGLDSVKAAYPNFGTNLANGKVPKEEAQDVYILVLEAAKESIQKSLNTPLEEDDPNLFALIDLNHASPSMCSEVIKVYNSKNNNLSKEETMQVFTENWGSNENYGVLLRRRGRNRGWLASEGRWFLYQEGSEGDEVIFDSDTPWTEFCEGGGTAEMTQESSGLYHVEKGVDTDYIKE